jgi:hypothetical protein
MGAGYRSAHNSHGSVAATTCRHNEGGLGAPDAASADDGLASVVDSLQETHNLAALLIQRHDVVELVSNLQSAGL